MQVMCRIITLWFLSSNIPDNLPARTTAEFLDNRRSKINGDLPFLRFCCKLALQVEYLFELELAGTQHAYQG
jgi:hypothetical protein